MTPVFNYEASLRRMGHDGQLFREMIGLLQEDSPRLLHQVESALKERDAERVRHAAHTLKGLTANFSGLRAMEAAEALEKLARASKWDEMGRAATDLDEAVAELRTALQPLAAASNGPTGGAAPQSAAPLNGPVAQNSGTPYAQR
jgi:HPt (histidine-containing phosphotransfer) domain-containing protein